MTRWVSLHDDSDGQVVWLEQQMHTRNMPYERASDSSLQRTISVQSTLDSALAVVSDHAY